MSQPENSNYTEPAASQAPPDIPHPVRPLKRSGGWVLPYRGLEAHGVNPNVSPPHPVPDVFDEAHVVPEVQRAPARAEERSSRPASFFTTGPKAASTGSPESA